MLTIGRPLYAVSGVHCNASQSPRGAGRQRGGPKQIAYAVRSAGSDEQLRVVGGDVLDARSLDRAGTFQGVAAIQRDLRQRSIKVGGKPVEINSGAVGDGAADGIAAGGDLVCASDSGRLQCYEKA